MINEEHVSDQGYKTDPSSPNYRIRTPPNCHVSIAYKVPCIHSLIWYLEAKICSTACKRQSTVGILSMLMACAWKDHPSV